MPFDMGLRGKDLFDHIRKQIQAEPSTWDQTIWGTRRITGIEQMGGPVVVEPCGAAYCVAGWAVLLCGDPLVFVPGMPVSTITLSGGNVKGRAIEFLGIKEDQANMLFDDRNRLFHLDEIAAEIWPEKGE